MSDTARERERGAAMKALAKRFPRATQTSPEYEAGWGEGWLARAEQEAESGEAWDWADQAVVDYESSEGIDAVGRDELRKIIHDALTGFARAEPQPDEVCPWCHDAVPNGCDRCNPPHYREPDEGKVEDVARALAGVLGYTFPADDCAHYCVPSTEEFRHMARAAIRALRGV